MQGHSDTISSYTYFQFELLYLIDILDLCLSSTMTCSYAVASYFRRISYITDLLFDYYYESIMAKKRNIRKR